MERPASSDPRDISRAKIEFFKCIQPLELEDVVLGQAVASSACHGYLDVLTQSTGITMYVFTRMMYIMHRSHTPTLATILYTVHNERWEGVPFIVTCGLGTASTSTIITIQYKPMSKDIFSSITCCNEIEIDVINNSVTMHAIRHQQSYTPWTTSMARMSLEPIHTHVDTHSILMLDAIRGNNEHYINDNELDQCWRILSPLLFDIHHNNVEPVPYPNGSDGPHECHDFIRRAGYRQIDNTASASSGVHDTV